MPIHKKFTFYHVCDLPQEINKEVPQAAPYSNRFLKFCWKFKDYFTVSPTHHDCAKYFGSRAAIYQEKIRHLSIPEYRRVIHPLSKFSQYQNGIASLIWFVLFFADPFVGVFYAGSEFMSGMSSGFHVLHWPLICLNVFMFYDFVLRFFTGYVINQTQEIVLEPRKIVKNYLRTYFVSDLAPVLTCLVVFFLEKYHENAQLNMSIYGITSLRLLRLKTAFSYMKAVLIKYSRSEAICICVFLLLWTMYLTHWWACILGALQLYRELSDITVTGSWIEELLHLDRHTTVNSIEEIGFWDYYLHNLLQIFIYFFGCGFGRFRTTDASEMIIFSFVSLTGYVFYLFCASIVLKLFGVVNVSESKYDQLIAQVTQFLQAKKYPKTIRKRINAFYEYKFDRCYFSEETIFQDLSEHLQMEILLHSCKNLITNVKIFEGLSKGAVGSLLAVFKQEIYLPRDVIYNENDTINKIYFILYGTCALILRSGKEVLHIEDGNHFGDIRPRMLQSVTYSVVALEASQIYTLSVKNFKYCCTLYPEIAEKFDIMTKETNRCINIAVAAAEDYSLKNDIVGELRRGRILARGLTFR